MSQEQTSGQQSSDSVTENTQQTETVPKAHADKLLGETKAAKQKAKELQDKLDAIERERLEKEGKTSELLDKYKKDLELERENSKTYKSKIVQDRVKFALNAEAEKLGFKNDKSFLEKLVDFGQIEVDPETQEVNAKDVTKVLTDLKTKIPELFKAPATKPNDLPPKQGDVGTGNPTKNLADLKEDELKSLLSKLK